MVVIGCIIGLIPATEPKIGVVVVVVDVTVDELTCPSSFTFSAGLVKEIPLDDGVVDRGVDDTGAPNVIVDGFA